MGGAGPDPRAHEGLVRAIALEYRGRGLDLDDLVQEGFLGLLRACAGYDGRGDTPFPAYAAILIRRQIQRAIIDQAFPIRLPYHLHRLRRRQRAGRDVGPAGRALLEVAAPHWRPAGTDGPTLEELAPAPEQRREDPWERDRLRAAVAGLPEPDRRVIQLRHGDPPRTLAEVGAALGRSAKQIHRWEGRALRRLRLALGPDATD